MLLFSACNPRRRRGVNYTKPDGSENYHGQEVEPDCAEPLSHGRTAVSVVLGVPASRGNAGTSSSRTVEEAHFHGCSWTIRGGGG